jgi:uncharacterized C2H2 Zn-finger protein
MRLECLVCKEIFFNMTDYVKHSQKVHGSKGRAREVEE